MSDSADNALPQTAQGPSQTRNGAWQDVAFRVCRSIGVLKLGTIPDSIAWPVGPPVYASYLALRPSPQDSEPVWLSRPSPYGSFICSTLPVPCMRTGLTLRHVIPSGVAA